MGAERYDNPTTSPASYTGTGSTTADQAEGMVDQARQKGYEAMDQAKDKGQQAAAVALTKLTPR